jgi:acylphosphatase
MTERCRIIVRGYVQGVSFRWYTRREASALGLDGWVRNLADGSVEIVAEGERAVLAELIAWAREGPSGAEVGDLAVEYSNATGEYSGFTIR